MLPSPRITYSYGCHAQQVSQHIEDVQRTVPAVVLAKAGGHEVQVTRPAGPVVPADQLSARRQANLQEELYVADEAVRSFGGDNALEGLFQVKGTGLAVRSVG